MKRILSIIMIFSIVLLCCSCKNKNSSPSIASEQDTIVRIMSVYARSNSDQLTAPFLAAIEDAREAFPNVDIRHEAIDTETYKNTLKIRIASNDLSDIVYTWSDGFIEPFISNEYILPMNDYVTSIDLKDDRFSAYDYEDNCYGVSMMYWYGVLYYNNELFEKCDLPIPNTWNELVNACRILSANGIEPFSCGMKDIWPCHLFVNQLLLQIAGAERYNAIARGKEKITLQELKIIASHIQELLDAGAFSKKNFTRSNDESMDAFVRGEAAMTYCGNNFIHLSDNRISAHTLPIIPECNHASALLGKCSNGLSVTAGASNPKLATEIALFIAEKAALSSGYYTPWHNLSDWKPSSDLETQRMSILQSGSEWGNNYDVLLPAGASQDYIACIRKFFVGEIDKDSFAHEAKHILDNLYKETIVHYVSQ